MNDKKQVLNEIIEMMAYHSRVAKKPVWLSWGQIWDIMQKAESFSNPKRRKMTRSFPSRQTFTRYASTHPNITSKRIRVKETFEGITRMSRNLTTFFAYDSSLEQPHSTFEQPRSIYMREVAKKK